MGHSTSQMFLMGPLPCADACCAQVRNAMTAPDGQNPRGDKLSQHTAVPRHGAGSPLPPRSPPSAGRAPSGCANSGNCNSEPNRKNKKSRRKARQTGPACRQYPPVDAPKCGRPKKTGRIKSSVETQRQRVAVRCSKCHGVGHNSRNVKCPQFGRS
jgi:hypothetical protein